MGASGEQRGAQPSPAGVGRGRPPDTSGASCAGCVLCAPQEWTSGSKACCWTADTSRCSCGTQRDKSGNPTRSQPGGPGPAAALGAWEERVAHDLGDNVCPVTTWGTTRPWELRCKVVRKEGPPLCTALAGGLVGPPPTRLPDGRPPIQQALLESSLEITWFPGRGPRCSRLHQRGRRGQ